MRGNVSISERSKGVTVWLTGLPSAGKSTIAYALEKRLIDEGRPVEVLDGDVVRSYLTKGLGFSKADRDENVRRVGWVANLLSRNGITVLCALVSPYRALRDELRELHDGRFIEVHVATPLGVCSQRDVKGLYEKHREGKLTGLTGVDDPYEPPLAPEITIPAHHLSIEESVEVIWRALPR